MIDDNHVYQERLEGKTKGTVWETVPFWVSYEWDFWRILYSQRVVFFLGVSSYRPCIPEGDSIPHLVSVCNTWNKKHIVLSSS